MGILKNSLFTKNKKKNFIVLAVILSFLCLLIYSFVNYLIHDKVNESLANVSRSLNDFFVHQKRYNLSIVLALSENCKIKKIYRDLKREVGDLTNVSENNREIFIKHGQLLRLEIEPYLRKLKNFVEELPHLHFHLPVHALSLGLIKSLVKILN